MTHKCLSRVLMPVSKASVPDREEMVCCKYLNGLPSSRLNGSGIHCMLVHLGEGLKLSNL